jgi:hypothetical protein
MKPRPRDSFDKLKEALAKFQLSVGLRASLHDQLEEQFDQIIEAFRSDPPVPGRFSSPVVASRFTMLADICRRLVFAAYDPGKPYAPDPATPDAATNNPDNPALKLPIIEFFAHYKFPIDLAFPRLGEEDDYLDDPELFVRMAMQDLNREPE